MKNSGIVFDIKKYSLHDGPGIRTTVFLKGCPLECWWCHNPESRNLRPDVVEKTVRRREFITHYSENQDAIGKEVTVEEIIKEVEKDVIFYDESGGGVTFSGGEPLMQPDFLWTLLVECKERSLHTAVDTSGYAPFDVLDRMIQKTDLFLYDLKLMDDEEHQKYTGVSGMLILDNLNRLVEKGKPIDIRIPIIPKITDTEYNLNQIMEFLVKLDHIRNVSLLPFNCFGTEKYKRLRIKNKMVNVSPPSQDVMEVIKSQFENRGFHVKIGG